MTHRLRVEVFVDDLRVSEVEGTFEGTWDNWWVFVAHDGLQRFLYRAARRMAGLLRLAT